MRKLAKPALEGDNGESQSLRTPEFRHDQTSRLYPPEPLGVVVPFRQSPRRRPLGLRPRQPARSALFRAIRREAVHPHRAEHDRPARQRAGRHGGVVPELSAGGGNFVRIWLSNPFFDVEHGRSGEFDPERAKRIDALLALARKYGIRLKLCTEHFRHLGEGTQKWAGKPQHLVANGGPAKDTADFFQGEAGRRQYKRKLAWYADRYGSDPIVFGWELWNEMNAVRVNVWRPWSAEMLPELHRLFPKNLAMQSLGSYDREASRANYRALCELPGNDVLQVHRYLDLGASWKICHGPVAVLRGRGGARPAVVRHPQAGPPGRERRGRAEPLRPVQALRQGPRGDPAARRPVRPVLCRRGRLGAFLALGRVRGPQQPLAPFRPVCDGGRGLDPPAEALSRSRCRTSGC